MKLKFTVGLSLGIWEHMYTEEGKAKRLAFARMVRQINDPTMAQRVMDRVLVPYLKVPPRGPTGWGAAEYFEQYADITIPWHPDQHCNHIGLSGVSVNLRRAPYDFLSAVQELQRIGADVVRQFLPVGEKAQVFPVSFLDGRIRRPDGTPGETSLVEEPGIIVEGQASLPTDVNDRILYEAEVAARIVMPDHAGLLISSVIDEMTKRSLVLKDPQRRGT